MTCHNSQLDHSTCLVSATAVIETRGIAKPIITTLRSSMNNTTTTTTIKSQRQPTQRVRRVAGRPVTRTTTIINNNKQTKRRQRVRQLNRLANRNILGDLSQPEGIVESLMTPQGISSVVHDSVHKEVQTLFFGHTGLHRGAATGDALTAIAYSKNSIVLNGFTTVNNVLSMYILPAGPAAPIMIAYNYNTSVADPSLPGGSGSVLVPGPFNATNPSTGYRTISFSWSFIPAGPYTAQSGEGAISYFTDVNTLTNTGQFTRTNIDNLRYTKPINGVSNMRMHWVPNLKETVLLQDPLIANPRSGFALYLNVPPAFATGTEFRFEYSIGVEYLPTTAYRPFVPAMQPDLHPDTFYYINKIITYKWPTLMIADAAEYDAECANAASAVSSGIGPQAMMTSRGQTGLGSQFLDRGVQPDAGVGTGYGIMNLLGKGVAFAGGLYANGPGKKYVKRGLNYTGSRVAGAIGNAAMNHFDSGFGPWG